MPAICAYNVNLDAVHNVTGDDLSLLMEGTNLVHYIEQKLPERISSPGDLLSGLLFCMKEGSGAELQVNSPKIAQFIERSFNWECRLGGNAGNMANALAELGAEPILNIPDLGKRLASHLHSRVMIPMPDGTLATPSLACKAVEEPVHFVFQFGKGEIATSHNGTIISPRENRLIASYDRPNRRMSTDPHFDAYCAEHLDEMDGALVSGFHLVPFEGYREVLDGRLQQIRSWKDNKPKIYIHAEMGGFQKPEIMQHILDQLPADSIGMNEDELAMVAIFQSTCKGILEAARILQENLCIPRICIHTKDLIISVLVDRLIHPEEEVKALEYGAEVAAGLALTGKVTAKPPIQCVSPAGMAAVDEFCKLPGAIRFSRGAYVSSEGQHLCLVPSLMVIQPEITVGLGDAMTAAAFFWELKSISTGS